MRHPSFDMAFVLILFQQLEVEQGFLLGFAF